MLKQITLPLTLLLLLSACGSHTNLPSSVSYSRMSAQSSTSGSTSTSRASSSVSRASTATSSARAEASVGSRLSARQSGMQDSVDENYSDAERSASLEAEIDQGSMIQDSARNNPDLHSSRSRGCGANAGYDESLLCNGASAQ